MVVSVRYGGHCFICKIFAVLPWPQTLITLSHTLLGLFTVYSKIYYVWCSFFVTLFFSVLKSCWTLNSHEQSYLSYTVPWHYEAKSYNWKHVLTFKCYDGLFSLSLNCRFSVLSLTWVHVYYPFYSLGLICISVPSLFKTLYYV